MRTTLSISFPLGAMLLTMNLAYAGPPSPQKTNPAYTVRVTTHLRANTFREALDALSLPADTRATLVTEHKGTNTSLLEGNEITVRFLSYLTQNQRTSIMDGNKLEFPAEKPPLELAPHITETIKGWKVLMPTRQQAEIFDQGGKHFSIERFGEGAQSRLRVTFSVQDEKGRASFGFAMSGARPEEVYKDAYTPDHSGPGYADARQTINVPTKLTADSLETLLEKVADTFHIDIIGESYWEGIPTHGKPEPIYYYSVPAGFSSPEKALNASMPQNFWKKEGGVYLFQRHLWWMARRADITNLTQVKLTQVLARQPLSFEDAAEVCKTLSPEQWHWLVPAHMMDYFHMSPVQTALSFYGSLPPSQRTEIFRADGLEVSRLNEADRKRLNTWISETGYEALQGVQHTTGIIRIVATRLTQDIQFSPVTFRAVFQAATGARTLLREQTVQVSDLTEHHITSEDPDTEKRM